MSHFSLDIIERTDDDRGVDSRTNVLSLSSREVVSRLRAQVEAMEARRVEQVYPVPEVLAPLLPDNGLRPGAAYCLGSSGALLLSLLASSCKEGLWCGVVGVPDMGVEAAGLAGVTLDRLALIPNPGAHWLSTVALLSSAVPVVAVRPPSMVRQADASRLAARMRDNESVLLVVGSWPGSEATISVDSSSWHGLGEGWGCLSEHEVTIRVMSKRYPRPRSVHVLLPGPDGRIALSPLVRSDIPDEVEVVPRLRRVA